MMIRRLLLLVVMAITIIGCAFAGYRYAQHRARGSVSVDHYQVRSMAIHQQAKLIPKGGVLIVGDSIVEFSYTPILCGLPVLNAGIGGIGVERWIDLLPSVFADAKPSRVVFALGVNDTQAGRQMTPEQWASDFGKLISEASAAKVSVVAINPVEPSKPVGATFDRALIVSLNQQARKIASRAGATFIDAPARERTIDGVHLVPAASAAWTGRLRAAC